KASVIKMGPHNMLMKCVMVAGAIKPGTVIRSQPAARITTQGQRRRRGSLKAEDWDIGDRGEDGTGAGRLVIARMLREKRLDAPRHGRDGSRKPMPRCLIRQPAVGLGISGKRKSRERSENPGAHAAGLALKATSGHETAARRTAHRRRRRG